MNLTQIKNATEGDELRDDEVTGLQLRVRGGNKAWFLYYRVKGTGQRRRPKIGDWPGITLQAAREIAREWLGEVSRGKDPSAERASLRGSETVASLCDRYLAETEDRPSYRNDDGRVKNYIKPAWGKRRVSEVTKADLDAMRRKMKDKPIAFNRLRALVSTMWRWAEYPSPTVGVKRYEEQARRRYLTESERVRFLAALEETEIQYPHACALIKLLILTGARRSELSTAKRAWYRDRVLTLDKHKTARKSGRKTIPFSQAADDVVYSVEPRGGWLVGFSSNPWDAWELIRTRADLVDFKLHDLRHSFASFAIGKGRSLAEVGEVLGHKDAATTKRYAHLSEPNKLAVAEDVSDSVLAPPHAGQPLIDRE